MKKELSPEEQIAKSKRVGKRRKHEYTKEEEKVLIKQAQEGDRKAIWNLISVNDKYINSFVRKRKYETDLNEEDLKQEAIMGMIEAINKFDSKYDVKLVTYAHFPINKALNNAVLRNKALKISQYGFNRYRKINQVIAEETKKTGEVPSMAKISAILEIPENVVDYILAINNVFSVDNGKFDDSTEEIYTMDVLDEVESIAAKEYDEYNDLYEIINSLPVLQREVLLDYYGLNGRKKVNIHKIKKKYGLTQETLDEILQNIYEIVKANL